MTLAALILEKFMNRKLRTNRKLYAFVVATGLLASAGLACAAGAQQSLESVTVTQGWQGAIDCTPPSSSAACSTLHAAIRANFTASEIGMLFGNATSSPGYLTSYSRVNARYKAFLRDYETSNGSVAVASK